MNAKADQKPVSSSLLHALFSGVEALPAMARGKALPAESVTVAAVITSFNKLEDMRKNLAALAVQTRLFDRILVVDNCSSDGSIEMIKQDYPEVDLTVMPHSGFGACETFNIGFRKAGTDLVAILDDDVQLPPYWLEKMLKRMEREPPTTGLISSRVSEPNMPSWFKNHPAVTRERYMSTFRGCATLARLDVLAACGYYAKDFFIYGNERDLTARVLKAGYRVLQYPGVVVQHATPFGMKAGPRSIYFHTRNLWWTLFKHATVWQIMEFLAGQLGNPFRYHGQDLRADAVGSIGSMKNLRQTPKGLRVLLQGTLAGFLGLRRCLKVRRICKAPDFSLPVK